MASGGRELRVHGEPVRWSAQHRHLGHQTNELSTRAKDFGASVCVCVLVVCMYGLPVKSINRCIQCRI